MKWLGWFYLTKIRYIPQNIAKYWDLLWTVLIFEYSYTNGYKFEMEIESTEAELEYMQRIMKLPPYERNQDLIFCNLINAYKNNYLASGSGAYKYWTKENHEKYLYLRMQIDEIIEKRNEINSI